MYRLMDLTFDYNCNGAISEIRIHTMVIRFPSEHVLLTYLVMAPGFSYYTFFWDVVHLRFKIHIHIQMVVCLFD
jgi:hypothetical protein